MRTILPNMFFFFFWGPLFKSKILLFGRFSALNNAILWSLKKMFNIGRRRSGLNPLTLRPYLPPRTPTAHHLRPSPPPRLDRTDATPSYCVDIFKGTKSNYVEFIVRVDTAHPKAFPNSVWLSKLPTPGTSEKFKVTPSYRLLLFVLHHLSLCRIFELSKLILSPFSLFFFGQRVLAHSLSLHLERYFSFCFLPLFLYPCYPSTGSGSNVGCWQRL